MPRDSLDCGSFLGDLRGGNAVVFVLRPMLQGRRPCRHLEVGCQESEKFVKGFVTGWCFDDAIVSNRATVL